MNKYFSLAVLALCLATLPLYSSGINQQGYRFTGEVPGPFAADSIYRIHLKPDVLKNSGEKCKDFRITDEKGSEVPYAVIHHSETASTGQSYLLRIVGYSEEADGDRIVLRVPRKTGPLATLSLNISGTGFLKKYHLQGSNDRKKWKSISRGLVYDFYPTVELRKTEISVRQKYPRYLRIILKSSKRTSREAEKILLRFRKGSIEFSRRESRHLKIRSVRGRTRRGEKIPARYDRMKLIPMSHSDGGEGYSIFLASAGVPAEKAVLTISNKYFFREVEVEGSASGEADSWERLTKTSIHRFDLSGKKEEHVTLKLPGRKFAFVRFKIKDGDNPPLSVKKIEILWPRRYIYFIPVAATKKIMAWWGNTHVNFPEYDISHFINQSSWYKQRHTSATMGRIRNNPGYDPGAEGEGAAKYALFVFVFVLLGAMGIWIYRLSRHAKK